MTIGRTGKPTSDAVGTPAIVREILFLGESFKVTAMVGDHPVVVRAARPQAEGIDIGSEVLLAWPPERSRALAMPVERAAL